MFDLDIHICRRYREHFKLLFTSVGSVKFIHLKDAVVRFRSITWKNLKNLKVGLMKPIHFRVSFEGKTATDSEKK